MARIDRAQVDRIALLAQHRLSDAEAEDMARDLERILEYVDALQSLDTEGIEPTAHASALTTPLREDVPQPPMDPELAVATAPARSGTAFVVPKMIDGDEGAP